MKQIMILIKILNGSCMFGFEAESWSIAGLSIDVLLIRISSSQWDRCFLIQANIEFKVRRVSWRRSWSFSWAFEVLFPFRHFVKRQGDHLLLIFFLFAVVHQFHQFLPTTPHTPLHLSQLLPFYRLLHTNKDCSIFYLFEKIDLMLLHLWRRGGSWGWGIAISKADSARWRF